MDFMGIGALEVIVILLLGFLVFGPEKLPGIASKLGKWYRNFTRAANNFTQTLNEEISEEKKLGRSVTDTVKNELKSAIESPQESSEKSGNISDNGAKPAIESPQKPLPKLENNINNETDKNLNG
jgi:TatA/E family protein of Tat protein translocase